MGAALVDAGSTEAKLQLLRAEVRGIGRVVVAFSGGADSALLAAVARDELGDERVLAVTAVSPSLATGERDECARLASEWGIRWREVLTDEMERAAYRVNDGDRCLHCKDALMDMLVPIAAAEGAVVVLGVNCDDLGDHRPGQLAAAARGARFPMVDAGLSKADVRAVSHGLGLRTWDKPAAACLASRLPYGTPVELSTLSAVDRAERSLHGLGFCEVRVRHYGDTARIEVPVGQLAALVASRTEVTAAVHAAGYRYVTLDLDGLRSGNLNHALLAGQPARTP